MRLISLTNAAMSIVDPRAEEAPPVHDIVQVREANGQLGVYWMDPSCWSDETDPYRVFETGTVFLGMAGFCDGPVRVDPTRSAEVAGLVMAHTAGYDFAWDNTEDTDANLAGFGAGLLEAIASAPSGAWRSEACREAFAIGALGGLGERLQREALLCRYLAANLVAARDPAAALRKIGSLTARAALWASAPGTRPIGGVTVDELVGALEQDATVAPAHGM